MPCIQIHTNQTIGSETASEMKKELGKMISILPHKTEEWLMVILNDQCNMSFHGEENRPVALTEVKIWGNSVDREASVKMTAAITALLQDKLQVAPNDMYVRYVATMDWGWNGTNF